MVAASQPYAVNAGLKILREGGNAIDAAIATAAALAVTEPCSTGLGGDCFLLFYEAKTKKVHALNGSGRSSTSLTLEKLKRDLGNTIDPTHPHFVTVPGTAKGWEDAILKWGTKSFYDVLYPAIEIASNGFPVSPITSFHWNRGVSKIITQNDAKRAQDLLISDTTKDTTPRGPNPGEIFKNPHMARVLTNLGKNGASKTFYDGPVGQAIVDAVQSAGGALTMDDLRKHRTDFPDAVKTRYRNIDVWEHPPNGQGLAALIALAILNEIDPSTFSSSPSSRLHVLIESMRLAFADARKYVVCSRVMFERILVASFTQITHSFTSLHQLPHSLNSTYAQTLRTRHTSGSNTQVHLRPEF
jgi:gamma-glutamyltranspeptidase/glutathione hydrolase